MKKEDNLVYDLKWYMLIILVIIYFGFLIAGFLVLVYVLCFYTADDKIMMWTVISSMGSSACMCSVQYIKKLYKACIYGRINIIGQNRDLKVIGNFVYFLARPLFSIVFAVVLIFAIKAGFISIFEVENFECNDRFLYICTVISGGIGFSVGKVLDYLEKMSIENIKKLKENSVDGK